jgi:phenylacetic acid degradation operon negative regulatory protein
LFDAPVPPVRHQQLIVTIFGLYGRDPDVAIPVSALISMLGDLGYDAPGVRSSVSRLKAKGVLTSIRENRVAKYKLTESVMTIFHEGDRRIFAQEQPSSIDSWVLAVFSVPESMRDRRHQLRSELSALGFGSVASGVWIAPARVLHQTRERLTECELTQFVDFFKGDVLFDGPVKPKVAEWWDLKAIDEQFAEFLQLYEGAGDLWEQVVGNDQDAAVARSSAEQRRDAFRYYVPMLTLWRRFPYKDPNLPLDYLPDGWRGPAVHRTFNAVRRLTAPLAALYVEELLKGDAL